MTEEIKLDDFVEVKWGIYFAKEPMTTQEVVRGEVICDITDMYVVEGLCRLAQCHPLFPNLDYPSFYDDEVVIFLEKNSIGGTKATVFRFLHNLAKPE